MTIYVVYLEHKVEHRPIMQIAFHKIMDAIAYCDAVEASPQYEEGLFYVGFNEVILHEHRSEALSQLDERLNKLVKLYKR